MYTSDWEQLGIAPTRDLVAIKRAYAVRLKLTRPDDDAEAYQALRGAYERAQYWARYVEDEDEDENDEDTADESPDTSVEVAPMVEAQAPVAPPAAVAPEPEPELELGPEWLEPDSPADDETPEALAQRSFDCWRAGGDQALVEAWPQIEAALSRLPLSQRAEASARFADLVISVPNLPYAFLQPLQSHFGWLGDFRTDRLIGSARAEALRHALADVVVPEVTDPHILHQQADLLHLHRLLQKRPALLAWLHAALVGWPLQRRMFEASARLLLGLGIDVFDQRKIKAALEVGMWLRLAALVTLYFAVSVVLLRGNWQEGIEKTAVTVFFSVAVFGVMLVVGARVSTAFDGSVQWAPPIADRLARWRAAPLGPASGLLMMMLGTGLFVHALDDPEPLWLWASAVSLLAVGLLPVWPARADHGVVVAGVWGFLVVCLMRIAPREGLFGVMLGLAGACTMAGVMLSRWRGQFGGNRWFLWIGFVTLLQLARANSVQFGPHSVPMWGLIVLMALAAAWLSLRRAERDGHRAALTPMALAGGVVYALDGPTGGPWLLVGWVAAIVGFMLLQRVAVWLAGRWSGAATPSA